MTTRRVLLDTSFVMALLDRRDIFHRRATEVDKNLAAEGAAYVLADLVLIETAGVLARRAEQRAQPDTALGAFAGALDWIDADTHISLGRRLRRLLPKATRRLRGNARGLSLLDAVLVEYMLEAGIFEIASFDRDFDGIEGITRLS